MKASDQPTTLSARFDTREMEVLRKAAESRQWSLSQLVRAGAYEKAASILNAHEKRTVVREVLRRVAEQLLHPKAWLLCDGQESVDERWEASGAPLASHTLVHFMTCIRTMGSEVAALLDAEIEQLRGGETGFKPGDLIDPTCADSVRIEAPPVPERTADAKHSPVAGGRPQARSKKNPRKADR